jgi:predicted O-linked N-acetylglucosamine transferase (SPINDLY family)
MAQISIEGALQIAGGHHRAGRVAEAEALYREVLARSPDHSEALHLLGVLAGQTGHLDAAIALIGRAIAVNPAVALYHGNLGEIHRRSRDWERAIASLRRAIALEPRWAEAHNNLGNVFWEQGRIDDALVLYTRAIELKPDHAESHSNLGNLLKDQGRLDEAVAAYGRALALKPALADAHNNLGNALREQGRLDEALACYQRAVELRPDFAGAASNRLVALHYHPGYDAQAILHEHLRWARQFAEPLAVEIGPHQHDRAPDRRLRVGFVSPDFRDHPVGRLLLPLFHHHDRGESDFIGYSDGRIADAVTDKLKALADGWRETLGLSDRQVADRVRDDRIDILVDLALHTAENRMRVFARKPAPVQVTMLGLPATTGLATIDYRLTDGYLDPPGMTDADYVERSVRLPGCFWIYEPPEEAPPVGSLPAETRGFVTFGCLNQFTKISRPALQLWARVLQSQPGARLVLQSQPGSHRDAVRRLFEQGGVGERIAFIPRVSRAGYFQQYCQLDLVLDSFPYNGHTSTLDALWMGVPVVTLAGRTAVGRGGVSILSNLGLPELIARTPEQYIEIATGLARDRTRLAALRSELRPRMRSSPLMDGKRYAADVEAALRRMWRTWCRT